MGHHSLIALVTAAIHDLIDDGLRDSLAGATIRIGAPPALASDDIQASLCLLRLSSLPWRNDELPTRQPDGAFAKEPRTALAAHYFLSFDGRDAISAQILLGKIVSILNSEPVLTASRLERVRRDGPYPALHGVPPPDPQHRIGLVPEYPAADELWQLWDAFRASPRPSLHYVASPILIDSEMVGAGQGQARP